MTKKNCSPTSVVVLENGRPVKLSAAEAAELTTRVEAAKRAVLERHHETWRRLAVTTVVS